MHTKRSLWLALLAFCATTAFAQLKSPDTFLPHKWGKNFTPHHLLVDYVEHIAANSNHVKLIPYGSTNEARPLMIAVVSTPENLARLEDIRLNNLRRAGTVAGSADAALDRAIVWLSFSVHGNEASGSEASMGVLYDLVNPENAETKAWLKNTIVIIDPALNPDGYSRYTHWFRGVANRIPDPRPAAREHREPWPGGRVNHYYFDLNRDWAWQTQVESQQRAKIYHQWLPHVHADLHEQYYDAPYYFAPAAAPYHEYITKWQADFQVEIGKNHAKYFDNNGWLYFTKEIFDLLYPSYGDTYPTYLGSVGMTYEQGGHSRGGRAITMPNADTLTLKDRVTHHKTTALSTVEIASKSAQRVVENFKNYFEKSSTNPPGPFKTYIIKGSNKKANLKALCALLDKNSIRYGKASAVAGLKAFDYQTGKETTIGIQSNDLVITAYQPLAVMTQVLLDPQTKVSDSLTYDITSWSLPYAYGLEAYATTQRVEVKQGYEFGAYANTLANVGTPYAYLARWQTVQNARFLGELLQKGIVVRYATAAFSLNGVEYAPGTAVATRADNRKNTDFDAIVKTAALRHQQEIYPATTGFVEAGRDFGSESYRLIEAPRVAVLSGDDVSENEFGQVWHYFEEDLRYPLSVFTASELSGLNLDDFNLLIMPEGGYNIDDATAEKLNRWMSGGGRIIAIGAAVSSLEDKKGFSISKFASEDDKAEAESARERAALNNRMHVYEDQARSWLSYSLPGAVFKVKMDASHPLAFGLSDSYFSLKTNALAYPFLKDAWNVGTLGKNPMVVGFVGSKAKESLKNTAVFAVQDKGAGGVIYLIDNPLFRGFWENGKFLFSNAVFFAAQ